MSIHKITCKRTVNGYKFIAYHHTSEIADYYGIDIYNPYTEELVAAYEYASKADQMSASHHVMSECRYMEPAALAQ